MINRQTLLSRIPEVISSVELNAKESLYVALLNVTKQVENFG